MGFLHSTKVQSKPHPLPHLSLLPPLFIWLLVTICPRWSSKTPSSERLPTRHNQSFFPYKDRINRSQQSRVIYRANCWDCNGFYIGKTKRRLHDRKTEHFKALAKIDNTSAIADHVKTTGHNINWDQFDILAKGKTDYHCKIKETLYIQELEPAFNVNVGSEKLMLY